MSNLSTQLVIAYITLTIPLGTILILFDKAPSRNDFNEHWARARQVAAFQLMASPDPAGTGNYGAVHTDGSFVPFNNTAINSPFVYLPSMFGMGHLRLSSFFTLLFSVICVSLSIILSKKYCSVVFGAALLPSFFLSSIYPTADAVSNAFAFLWIAYILYMTQENRTPLKSIVACTVLAFFLGQIKATCICLLLLLALPVIQNYRNNKWIDYRFVAPLSAGIISAFIWMHAISKIPPSAVTTIEQYSIAKQDVLQSPGKVLTSLFVTLFNPIDLTSDPYDTGRNIQFFTGAEQTQLPLATMAPILFAFAMIILLNSGKVHLFAASQRFVIILTVIIYYALTCIGLIVSWGGIALGSYASGIQSRYFIPVIILAALCMPNLKISTLESRFVKIFISALILWSYTGLLLAHLLVFPWQS